MKPAAIRLIVTVAMLAQVWFLLAPAKITYRREERMRALATWKQSGTPESKAAWEAENKLRDYHAKSQAFFFIGGFLVFNGLLCWGVEKYVIMPTARRDDGR